MGLDTPDLGHLKRIRKQDETTTLLLGVSLNPPKLPAHLSLPPAYPLSVPTSSALTLASLNLKSALWPTLYTPRRKDEPKPWTRSRLRWAWDAMKRTVDAAIAAQKNGEVRVDTFGQNCTDMLVIVTYCWAYTCSIYAGWKYFIYLMVVRRTRYSAVHKAPSSTCCYQHNSTDGGRSRTPSSVCQH